MLACIVIMAVGIELGHLIEAWANPSRHSETHEAAPPRLDVPAEAPE